MKLSKNAVLWRMLSVELLMHGLEIKMNKYPQIHANNGPFISSQHWSDADRTDTEVYWHHKEKSEVMMTVASSWYGGDFMEFGSGDLNTFRDFLTAYNICGMTRMYEDVQFWAFDIFGKLDKDAGELKEYFAPYTKHGDTLGLHQGYVMSHGLYIEKCRFMQGLFADTLTKELKETWRSDKVAGTDYSETALHLPPEHRNSDKRQIGFASIDCNIPSAYKTVFEWIFDALAPNSYVYCDEGLQSPEVMEMWENFSVNLQLKRKIKTQYVRNAGGFGALYRLYPMVEGKLDL